MTETTGELPQSGNAYVEGCTGILSYDRDSNFREFKGYYSKLNLWCLNKCGVASVGLAVAGTPLPLPEAQIPEATRHFLNFFCGIARGLLDQNGNLIQSASAEN